MLRFPGFAPRGIRIARRPSRAAANYAGPARTRGRPGQDVIGDSMVGNRNGRTRSHSRWRLAAALCAGLLAVPGVALADWDWNFQPPGSSISAQITHLHENTTVEVVWTVIPLLILIFMAWPATKLILAMHDTSAPGMTVKVTGYQWKWGYDYVQEGFGFYSTLSTPYAEIENRAAKDPHYLLEVDNPLVVPGDTKVRVLVTAADVLHSWYVPAFGVQQDAIPGFVRDTWFEADKVGIYRGQCSKLCGKEHGFMPVVVEVKSKEAYAKWLAEQKQEAGAAAEDPNKVWSLNDLLAKGQQVFNGNCAACHQPNGTGNAAIGAPALVGDKVVLGPRDHQIDVVLNGQTNGVVMTGGAGGKMPLWKGLSDVEIASVISYTRNSWGNKAGENIVQPSEVKAERK